MNSPGALSRIAIRHMLAALVWAGLSLLVAAPQAQAQNYQNMRLQLQQEQEKARDDIASLRRQISTFEQQASATRDEYTTTYEQVNNLEREIALRTAVITTLEQERASIGRELRITQDQINDLTSDLNTLVENYKKTLTHLYKHGRTPQEALLFTSTSLNQMLVRSFYLKKFEEHRHRQARHISETRAELRLREEELDRARARNRQIITETRSEQQTLQERRQQQQQQIARLQRDRQRLEQRISATRNEASELESVLSQLIEEEIRIQEAEQARLRRLEEERERRLASAENMRGNRDRQSPLQRLATSSPAGRMPTDEERQRWETSFNGKKGQLPWPVPTGVISTRFGNRVHPVYGTRIDNPGIEILTEPRTDVQAVHDGYVFAVQPISGFGNTIFINHGKYITVYGNMSEIGVSRGSFVSSGQVIGRSGDSQSLNGASLFFMIREQSTNLDPEIWISSR